MAVYGSNSPYQGHCLKVGSESLADENQMIRCDYLIYGRFESSKLLSKAFNESIKSCTA